MVVEFQMLRTIQKGGEPLIKRLIQVAKDVKASKG